MMSVPENQTPLVKYKRVEIDMHESISDDGTVRIVASLELSGKDERDSSNMRLFSFPPENEKFRDMGYAQLLSRILLLLHVGLVRDADKLEAGGRLMDELTCPATMKDL